jgi:hypothetical protein
MTEVWNPPRPRHFSGSIPSRKLRVTLRYRTVNLQFPYELILVSRNDLACCRITRRAAMLGPCAAKSVDVDALTAK